MPVVRLSELLLPVVQAPMAGSQGSALAIAVSEAGGLGSLPCALLTPEAMRRELTTITQRTNRPFNVNFFCHTTSAKDAARETAWRELLAPYYAELALTPPAAAPNLRVPFGEDAMRVLQEFKPAFVSFHFGLPSADVVREIKVLGSTLLSTATTVDEARWLEANGTDVVIAQGLEAGGHRGHFLSDDLTRQMGTVALLPQIVRAVSVPVIAAGGIADAAGVRAALSLGAVAVQAGTVYLTSSEATTSEVHRAAIAGPGASHTAITNLLTGRPARGIVNRLMRELGPMRPDVPAFPLAAAAVGPLRATAEAQGSGDFSPLWAGQNVSGCRNAPAAEITRALAD